MYTEKTEITIINVETPIPVAGINLQNSGLPITFDSLGLMWTRLTDEVRAGIKDVHNKDVEYGICLNKKPDYLVGLESTMDTSDTSYFSFTIPAGKYIKAEFNAETHVTLVNKRLMSMQKEAKKWAKSNNIKINPQFTAEVYPAESKMEYPSMYVLFPVA